MGHGKRKRLKQEETASHEWVLSYKGDTYIATARTKTEARNVFKRALGLNRLPAGCSPELVVQ